MRPQSKQKSFIKRLPKRVIFGNDIHGLVLLMIDARSSHCDDFLGLLRSVFRQDPKFGVNLAWSNDTRSFVNVRLLCNPKIASKMRTLALEGTLHLKIRTSRNNGWIFKHGLDIQVQASHVHHVGQIQSPFHNPRLERCSKVSHPFCVHVPDECVGN